MTSRSTPQTRASKALVRQESVHVTDASLAATLDVLVPILRDYTLSAKRGLRLDDAYLNALTDRVVEAFGDRPNVLFVDSVRKPTRSIAVKGRTEVFCAVMEPSNEGSTYSVSRLHVSLDRAALTWSYDDSGLMLVPHLAERMIERGETRSDALRRAGRALYDNAGLLGLGGRLWAGNERVAATWNSAMLPLADGGVAMGTLAPVRAIQRSPATGRFTRAGYAQTQGTVPPLRIWPRNVHAAPELRQAMTFTGMTYIGGGDMTGRKERVRDLLLGVRERNPVIRLAGLAYLWPSSKSVQQAFDRARPALASAYQELAAIQGDPDVERIFGRKTWSRTPPLPWEERPEDVPNHRIEDMLTVPRWTTPEELYRLQMAHLARLEAEGLVDPADTSGDASTPLRP
jgi:hypothetical protein